MATYTEHYGLHQWESGDDFLRSDFNEDLLKADTALGNLERSILTNTYNIYNMLLQSYYEGKYTDYKKDLLLDGFMDSEDEGRVLSDGILIYDNHLALYETGETGTEDWSGTTTYNTWSTSRTTASYTVASTGIVTGYTFMMSSSTSNGQDQKIYFYLNGSLNQSITLDYYTADLVGSRWTVNLTTPVPVVPGDVIYFKVVDGVSTSYYYGTSGSALSGSYNITPIGNATGSLTTTKSLDLDWTQCHLWVRWNGVGDMTPTVNGVAMTLVESAASTTLQQENCTESHYIGGGGSDSLTFGLAFDLGSGEGLWIYDYGLVVM